MRPIVLPLSSRERYRQPRLLRDAWGVVRDYRPWEDDIPLALHLRYRSEQMREIGCRYRKMPGPKEETFIVEQGQIVIHETSGLLLGVRLENAVGNSSPYDQTLKLFQTYLAFARLQASTKVRPFRMLFSAEILNEFWQSEEAIIRNLLSAPYR